jgi:hypothetical protein
LESRSKPDWRESVSAGEISRNEPAPRQGRERRKRPAGAQPGLSDRNCHVLNEVGPAQQSVSRSAAEN